MSETTHTDNSLSENKNITQIENGDIKNEGYDQHYQKKNEIQPKKEQYCGN